MTARQTHPHGQADATAKEAAVSAQSRSEPEAGTGAQQNAHGDIQAVPRTDAQPVGTDASTAVGSDTGAAAPSTVGTAAPAAPPSRPVQHQHVDGACRATQPPGGHVRPRPSDPDGDAPSVRLGGEHAVPVPASLSMIAAKRALFAVDSYFRDSWEDLRELPPADVDLVLRRHALLLLKPDATAGRRLHTALSWLAEQGTVVAAEPVRLDRHTARAMWQYQWNVATRDRRDLADLLACADDALVLIARLPEANRPATVRLAVGKGPADPALRRPGQLRHRLGSDNFLLNFVHTADEPADLVREIGVLFDAPARHRLYLEIVHGQDVLAHARAEIERLHDRLPAQDLDPAAVISRWRAGLGDTTGPVRRELAEALDLALEGRGADWREVCDLAERCGAAVGPWERIVLGTHLMSHSDAAATPILAGIPVEEWDRQVHQQTTRAPLPATTFASASPNAPIADAALSEKAGTPPSPLPPATARSAAEQPSSPAHRQHGVRSTLGAALGYDQPVPRELVHKSGIEEVFVTGSAQLSAHTFVLTGELPRTHCYFSDLPAPCYDLMPLLELVRQAYYTVAHRHLGVPADRRFLVRRFGADLDPAMASVSVPDRLRVEASLTVERMWTNTRLPGMSASLAMTTPDQRPVATARVSGCWLTGEAYADLRAEARTSRGLDPRPGRPVSPDAPLLPARGVGRTAQRNVVLAQGEGGQDPFGAQLAADPGNPGMFNHLQDHVPGMVLLEAARQTALAAVARHHATDGDPEPTAFQLRALHASFTAIAELDLPLTCEGDVTDGAEPGTTSLDLRMVQNGAPVSRMSAAVVPAAAVGAATPATGPRKQTRTPRTAGGTA